MTDATPEPAANSPGPAVWELARPPRTIVPLGGLPFVGVALAFLLTAVVGGWLWALEFAHVAFGAAWTIIDLFFGLVIGPLLGRMSMQARIELTSRLMPQMSLIMPTVVTVTLVAGFQLAVKLGTIYSAHPHHAWVLASFAVVGVMTMVALGVNEPTNLAVLFEMRKPKPNGELIERLMRRFVYSAGVLGVMQVATLIIMARLAS